MKACEGVLGWSDRGVVEVWLRMLCVDEEKGVFRSREGDGGCEGVRAEGLKMKKLVRAGLAVREYVRL